MQDESDAISRSQSVVRMAVCQSREVVQDSGLDTIAAAVMIMLHRTVKAAAANSICDARR